jgi:DNA-directed RNA polymerase sigma subunit (sigma70/sigma32)
MALLTAPPPLTCKTLVVPTRTLRVRFPFGIQIESTRKKLNSIQGADEHLADLADEARVLRDYMAALKSREKEILERRANGETLRSIAVAYGVSSECVRLTEQRALRKLAVAFGQEPERVRGMG